MGHTATTEHLSDLLESVNVKLTNFATNTFRFDFLNSGASTGYNPDCQYLVKEKIDKCLQFKGE